MYKISKKIIVSLLVVGQTTSTQVKAQSAAKNAQPVATQQGLVKKVIKNQSEMIEGLSPEDVKKYNNQLKATDLILKSEKNESKREDLYFRRAFAHIMLARFIGYKRTDREALSADEKNHIDSALKVLDFYEPKSGNKPQRLAEIYYMRGMIAMEYNQQKIMSEHFKKVIQVDPGNNLALNVSITLGEYFYDTDQYSEAVRYYQLYSAKLTTFQRSLADYKTAWCYLGLKDTKTAQKYFIKIVNGKDPQFKEDSVKDLAFLLIQYNSEQEVIQFLKENIQEVPMKIKFLTSAFEASIAKDSKQPYQLLYNEILNYDLKASEKARIHMLKLGCDRREFPTQQSVIVLMRIDKLISELNKEEYEKFKFSSLKQLEEHHLHLIRVYSEAYSGKLANPEKITRPELLKSLLDLIQLHLSRYPQSEKHQFITNLWIDLCRENSNLQCLGQIETYLSKQTEDKNQKNNLEVVRLSKMNIWDKAYSKEPEKFRDGFKKELLAYLSQHSEGAESLKIRKRLFGIYIAEKNDDSSLNQAKEIYKRESSTENLKNIVLLLVKMNKLEELKAYEKNVDESKDREIQEAYRESLLRKAVNAKNANNFSEYKTNLKYFLSRTSDKKKKMVAIVDLLNEVLKKNSLEEFEIEWRALSSEEKHDASLDDIKEKTIVMMLDQKKVKLIEGIEKSSKSTFTQLLYKTSLNMFDAKDWKYVSQLSEKERLYFLSHFLLQNPKIVYEYLHAQKKLNDAEKHIALNAYYLKSQSMSIDMSPLDRKWFGVLAPKEAPKYKQSKIAPRYKTLPWPSQKLSEKKYSAISERIATDVAFLRKKVLSELSQISYDERLTLLSQAELSENKCAEMLLNSPLPAELTPEQVEQYKAELKKIADGYAAQAIEFRKVKEELESKQKKNADDVAAKKLPEFDTKTWPWNEFKSSEALIEMSHQVSLFAALVCLDRDLEAKKVTNREYAIARTGLIAIHQNNEAIREYLRQELEDGNQVELLDRWRKVKK